MRTSSAGWPQTSQPLADRMRARSGPCPSNPPRPRTPMAGREPRSQSCTSPGFVQPVLVRPQTLAGLRAHAGFAGWLHTLQSTSWLQPTTTVREANWPMLRCAHSNT